MKIFAIGATVKIGDDIPARIVGVSIYESERVQYHVAWWNRKTEWVESFEISSPDLECQIGFKSA